MKTERLHYEDPLRLELESTVVAHSEHRGRPSVILDRTVLYAEAGGQMADRGTLGGVPVVDVQLDDEGRVHHVLDGALPALGATVRTVVAERRRREHMALHTGQHALSHALLDHLGAVTVSSRLGESACTIDVDRDGLKLVDLRPVEDAVNALIDEDRPIRQFFPSEAELAALALRKPPPDTDRVRVVVIEGFDVTPCGGTHCTHTAQIELVRIESVERYKGGSRITFTAGPRARRALVREADLLRGMASELSCALAEVPDVLSGLRRKLEEARVDAGTWRAALAAQWAERLAASGSTVVASVPGADAALLKQIGERLASGERLVALAAPGAEGTDVVVMRGAERSTHCGELLKRVAAAVGGRGGGRPDAAQGRLPAGIDWESAVRGVITD
jgi:alanyl-tRNA synthetase